jgi:hypothetical protein
MGDDYVKNVLDLPEIVADRVKQWADCLGMAYFDVSVDKEKHKLTGVGKRVITFTDNPIHEAKSGLSWSLPEKIVLDLEGKWGQLAFTGSLDENREVVQQIDALIDSYPLAQRSEIRSRFETIDYRTMDVKTLTPYLTAAQAAKGK